MAYPEGSPEALSKEGYDAQAQRYHDWTLSKPSLREPQVEKVLSLLPDASSASVLELGCGAGIPSTKMLAERCGSVVANDISSTMISLARRHLADAGVSAKVTFEEGSMTGLDFPEAKFDAVVAFYSIIHLNPANQKLIFERIRDWIKPNGILLVNLATVALPGLVIKGWLDMKAAYWSSFGQEENSRLLGEYGFEILSCEISEDAGDAKFGWFIARRTP